MDLNPGVADEGKSRDRNGSIPGTNKVRDSVRALPTRVGKACARCRRHKIRASIPTLRSRYCALSNRHSPNSVTLIDRALCAFEPMQFACPLQMAHDPTSEL